MKKLLPLLVLVLISIGCDQANVKAADSKPDTVTISNREYDNLKAEAALAKQVGRYQIAQKGATTWRLDTATGDWCLLLATHEYWQKDAKGVGCRPANDPLGIR